jgi:hypothetical protein
VKCAAGAAFSPAGGAVVLRTLAHVRVGDAAIQADTAVLRALGKDTLCGRGRAADARCSDPQKPALLGDSSRLLADGGVSGSSVQVRARETAAVCSLGAPSPR